MSRFLDLVGQKFGRLLVIAGIGRAGRRYQWECRCACGGDKVATTQQLRSGHTKSCGCLHTEANKTRRIRHGGAETPEYKTWSNMKARCENPNNGKYERYGARGIVVCPEWRDSFEQFLRDMGPRPSSRHSIERLNNDCGYAPGNCVLATADQQARNKVNNRWIVHNGTRDTLTGWAKRLGVSPATLCAVKDPTALSAYITSKLDHDKEQETP